jgi:hypothetical protein
VSSEEDSSQRSGITRAECDDRSQPTESDEETEQDTEVTEWDSGDDTGPVPWVSIDYEASHSHFGSDDNVADLDQNNTAIDTSLMGRTSIQPSDGDDPQKWKRLQRLNDGYGESDRNQQIWNAGVKRDLDIICDRLNATDHHHERAKWLLERIEIKEELLKRGSVEAVLMGIVSMVIDEDRTKYARQGVDDMQSVTRDDAFTQLREEYDIDNRTIHTVRKRLRETEVYESPNK